VTSFMRKQATITILFVLLMSLIGPFSLQAQLDSIWPGDVNNNGVVNGVDALYIGVAMGAAGPPRSLMVPDWVSLPAPPPWSRSFPSGLNYYYADCNGNGRVTPEDIDEGVERNFLESRGESQADNYANARPGEGPSIELRPEVEVVGENTRVTVEVFVGDEERPLRNFYGVAMALSYRSAGGSTLSPLSYEEEPGSWIDPSGRNSFHFFQDVSTSNEAYLTLSRTNQSAIPGGGKVGEFSIIMEDIVLGREVDTLTIQIDSVLLIDQDLNPLPTVPDTAMVFVQRNPNSVTSVPRQIPTQLYPNPARREAFLTLAAELTHAELYSARGQRVALRIAQPGPQQYHFAWPTELPAGIYYLRWITTDGHIESRKLFINK
jgi:hypothetical protein